jgi:hypothetical protein
MEQGRMFRQNNQFVLFWVLAILASPAMAQDEPESPLLGPLNSDPLTIRGISPRVLDIALFPMAQGLYWELLKNYQIISEGDEPRFERFRMVFDPFTDYGRDLFIEFENEPLRSVKEYKRSLEVTMGMDHWVRQENRLYDPKSLRVTKSIDGYEIIAFRFDKHRVPSSLRWLTRLSGEVHIVDGVLDRIEFQAEKTIERDGVRHYDYSSAVGFGSVDEHGGYVIDWIEEKFSFRHKRRMQSVHSWSRMLKYEHAGHGEISWVHAPDALFADKPTAGRPVVAQSAEIHSAEQEDLLNEVIVTGQTRKEVTDEFDAAETVRLDLRRTLPFWADDARKLGFELPKTYGVGVVGLWQNAEFDITDISLGGISAVDDVPLIDALGSGIDSTITSLQLRGDFWVLPFLNLSIFGGNLKTDSDVTLHFTPGFRALYKLKTGEDLSEFVYFPASTSATTLGVGLTSGLQYENLIASVSANYAKTLTKETSSKISALVILGMAGYDFGDIGMQLLAGIQYQKIDRDIFGTLDPGGEAEPIEFGIGIGYEETLFLIGVNKDIGRNWTLTGLAGMNGTRKQATVNFGYRW